MSESHPRVGVGVIVLCDGKVLLGRRRSSHGDGCWSFPGGHLEYGESRADCAVREVVEETGLSVHDVHFAAVTNDLFPDEGRHYVTLFMVAQVRGPAAPRVLEPDKCESWHWFDWDSMPTPLFTPVTNLLAQGFRPNDVGGTASPATRDPSRERQ